MSGRLLKYAEALRTGDGLSKVRRYRQELTEQYPVLIAALEAEMPYSVGPEAAPVKRSVVAKGDRWREFGRSKRNKPAAVRRLKPPTERQLAYLSALASALGRPSPEPATARAASMEIDRLRQVRDTARNT